MTEGQQKQLGLIIKSADGLARLVVVLPRGNAFTSADAKAFTSDLEAATTSTADGRTDARATGGHALRGPTAWTGRASPIDQAAFAPLRPSISQAAMARPAAIKSQAQAGSSVATFTSVVR